MLQEKPHKCSLCAKSFPTPGDLKAHMYVHTGTWPYRCTICTRGFSKQTNLKNHLQLHETGGLETELVPEDGVEEGDEEEEEEEEVDVAGEDRLEDGERNSREDTAVRMGPLSDFLLQMVQSARNQETNSSSSARRSNSPVSCEEGRLESHHQDSNTRIKAGFSNLFRPINM